MIDPSEAPEGFEAVEPNASDRCKGCSFNSWRSNYCLGTACTAKLREDGQNVIFKKKEKRG